MQRFGTSNVRLAAARAAPPAPARPAPGPAYRAAGGKAVPAPITVRARDARRAPHVYACAHGQDLHAVHCDGALLHLTCIVTGRCFTWHRVRRLSIMHCFVAWSSYSLRGTWA